MIILSILTTLLSLTQASPTPKLCSCSPRAFLFKLNLSTGFCPRVYPASTIFGNGIKDYTCRISLSPNNSDDNDIDLFGDPPRTTQEEEAVVNSIQFIEVDTNFNILHTSLVKDVTLYSGDTFRYTTLQNDDLIAGGLSIILRGKTAEGDDTENIFTVTYTNECGVRAFEGGERIGWVTIENLIPASSRSCDVVEEGDDVEFNVLSPSSSTGSVPTVKPSDVMHGRTPDGILKEILQLLEEKDDSLFVDGFVFLIEQALTAYYDSLVFDAIYKTTDASKDLGCDETGGGTSKGLICNLLSEALCGLAMEIGDASLIGAGVTSPTFFPSSGATSVVATGLTSPPTTAARPA